MRAAIAAGTDNVENVIPTRFIGDIARRVETLLENDKDAELQAKQKMHSATEKRLTLSAFPMPVLPVAPGVPISDTSLFKTPWIGVAGSRKHQPLLSDERVSDAAESGRTQNLSDFKDGREGERGRFMRPVDNAYTQQQSPASTSPNELLLSGLAAISASLEAEELPQQGKQTFTFPRLIDDEPALPTAIGREFHQQGASMRSQLAHEYKPMTPEDAKSGRHVHDRLQKPEGREMKTNNQSSSLVRNFEEDGEFMGDESQQRVRKNSQSRTHQRRASGLDDRPIWGSAAGRRSMQAMQETQARQQQSRQSQRKLSMTIEEMQDVSMRLHTTSGKHKPKPKEPEDRKFGELSSRERRLSETAHRERGDREAKRTDVQQTEQGSSKDDTAGRSRPSSATNRATKKEPSNLREARREIKREGKQGRYSGVKSPLALTEEHIPPDVDVPIWERSAQLKEERDKAIDFERRRLSALEKEQCTGTPMINSKSRAIARNKSVDGWIGRQQRKLEDLHTQLAAQKYSECTFRPQLTARSIRIFQQFRQTPEEFHLRILREHQERQAAKYAEQKHFLIKELGETFTPRITAKAASIQRNGPWWEELYADGKTKMKTSRSDDDIAYYGGTFGSVSGSTTARSGFRGGQSARSTSSRLATPSPSRATWDVMSSGKQGDDSEYGSSQKLVVPAELPPYKAPLYREVAESVDGVPVQQIAYAPDMDALLKAADQYAQDSDNAPSVAELAALTFGSNASAGESKVHPALRPTFRQAPSGLPFDGGRVRISLVEATGLRFRAMNGLTKPSGDPYLRVLSGSSTDAGQSHREVFRSEPKMQTAAPVWNTTGDYEAEANEDLLVIKLYDWVDSVGMGRITISIPDLLGDQPAVESWFTVEPDSEAPWAEGRVRLRITYPADELKEADLSLEAIRCLLPAERTPEAREKRRRLFDQMDTEGVGTVTLAEVDKCLCDVLHFDETLRGKPKFGLSAIRNAIQRAFLYANSHPTESTIERKEFRILLEYLWHDIELCRMMELKDADDLSRPVSLQEFRGLVPQLADSGIHIKTGTEREIFNEIDPRHTGEVRMDDFFNWIIGQKLENDDE